MTPEQKKEIQDMIDTALERVTAFNMRKIGDNPTDPYQLTPQQYVNANGSVASRPRSSVASIGQFYLATDVGDGQPMWFCQDKQWRDGNASVVA